MGRHCSIALCLCLLSFPMAGAHHPHDEVDSMAASASGEKVVVVMRSTAYISKDSGVSWTRLVHGVTDGEAKAVAMSPAGNRIWMTTRETNHLFIGNENDDYRWQRVTQFTGQANEAAVARTREFLTCGQCGTRNPTVFGRLGRGVIKSNDPQGRNWERILRAERVSAMACLCQREWIVVGTADGKVFLSTNLGETFQQVTDTGVPDVTALVFEGQRRVLIGTRSGDVYVYSFVKDQLKKRTKIAGGAVQSLSFSGNTLLAVASDQGVYLSTNRGKNWRQRGIFPPGQQAKAAGVPIFRFLMSNDNNMVLMGSHSGVFRSDNSGNEWFKLDALSSGLITGVALSSANGNTFTIAMSTLASGVVTATVRGANIGPWQAQTTEMKTHARLQSIAVSPTDSTLFVGGGQNLMMKMDVGGTWALRQYREAIGSNRYCGSWSFSPDFAHDNTLYVKCSKTPAQLPRNVAGTVLFKSEDGGNSFAAVATSAAIAGPVVPAQDGTLYWPKGEGQGLARSKTEGRTWTEIGNFDGYGVVCTSTDFSVDETLFYGDITGFYISRDGGDSFQALRRNGNRFRAIARDVLAISPSFKNDRTILVQENGGDLFKCTVPRDATNLVCQQSNMHSRYDGYLGFGLMAGFGKDQSIKILYSPLDANVVIASSADRLYISDNGGLTWQREPLVVRYDLGPNTDESQQFDFTGRWIEIIDGGHSMSAAMETKEDGATVQLVVKCARIEVIAQRSRGAGSISVFVDGRQHEQISLNGPEENQWMAATINLDDEPHKILLRVDDAGAGVVVDAIDAHKF